MPRPYNLIIGEGTSKNQRWGLGDLVNEPFTSSEQAIADAWDKIYQQQANDRLGYYGNINATYADGSSTVMGWLRNNSTWLLIGSVAGLLLWGRGR